MPRPELNNLKKILAERGVPSIWSLKHPEQELYHDRYVPNFDMTNVAWQERRKEIVELLATEQYGIAARKGSGLAKAINMALVELAKDGTVDAIAEKYGLKNEICIDKTLTFEDYTEAEMADLNYLTQQNKIIVGYTLFAPIAYKDNDGNLIGFDIDLAKAVGEYFGIPVEFKEINWATKEAELESKAIDCIWNGMTITEERKAAMEITIPYMNNKQVAVIRKEDKDLYKTTDDMKKAIIGAEDGSAGMSCVVKEEEE